MLTPRNPIAPLLYQARASNQQSIAVEHGSVEEEATLLLDGSSASTKPSQATTATHATAWDGTRFGLVGDDAFGWGVDRRAVSSTITGVVGGRDESDHTSDDIELALALTDDEIDAVDASLVDAMPSHDSDTLAVDNHGYEEPSDGELQTAMESELAMELASAPQAGFGEDTSSEGEEALDVELGALDVFGMEYSSEDREDAEAALNSEFEFTDDTTSAEAAEVTADLLERAYDKRLLGKSRVRVDDVLDTPSEDVDLADEVVRLSDEEAHLSDDGDGIALTTTDDESMANEAMRSIFGPDAQCELMAACGLRVDLKESTEFLMLADEADDESDTEESAAMTGIDGAEERNTSGGDGQDSLLESMHALDDLVGFEEDEFGDSIRSPEWQIMNEQSADSATDGVARRNIKPLGAAAIPDFRLAGLDDHALDDHAFESLFWPPSVAVATDGLQKRDVGADVEAAESESEYEEPFVEPLFDLDLGALALQERAAPVRTDSAA